MTTALRPRSVTELFDAAFQILRAHAGALLVLAAVAALPLMIAGLVAAAVMPTPEALAGGVSAGAGAAAFASLLTFPAWLWFSMASSAIVIAGARGYRGDAVDARDCLRAAVPRFGAVFAANFLKGMLLGIVFVVSFFVAVIVGRGIPVLGVLVGTGGLAGGIFLALQLYPVAAIATLETVDASMAFRRSATLTRGAKGRILGLYVISFVLMVAVYFVFAMLALPLRGLTPGVAAAVGALWYVGYALFGVMQGLLYIDLRVRNEGYDIELLAQELGGAVDGALPQRG
jgi:hypothetical protein